MLSFARGRRGCKNAAHGRRGHRHTSASTSATGSRTSRRRHLDVEVLLGVVERCGPDDSGLLLVTGVLVGRVGRRRERVSLDFFKNFFVNVVKIFD